MCSTLIYTSPIELSEYFYFVLQWIWHPNELGVPYKFVHFYRHPFKKIVSGFRWASPAPFCLCPVFYPAFSLQFNKGVIGDRLSICTWPGNQCDVVQSRYLPWCTSTTHHVRAVVRMFLILAILQIPSRRSGGLDEAHVPVQQHLCVPSTESLFPSPRISVSVVSITHIVIPFWHHICTVWW